MVKLSILSYNVRGLNAKVKRVKCLDLLRRKNVDIAFVQETHLREGDVSCFQNKQYKVVASDCGSSNSRGTVILTKRSLALEVEKINKGTTGRIAYLCTSIYGKKVAFVSVYAPAVFDPLFFPELTKELLSLLDYELIVGGDMNAVCDLNLDRSTLSVSHTQRAASAAFNAMIENINLVDMWRVQNQGIRDYTCFSAYHKSHSRIDYFLLSSSLKTGVDLIQVLPATLSDHNPLLMTMDLSHRYNKSPRWRFNTTLLQDEVFVAQSRERITELIANDIGTVDDASYIWMAT